MTHVASATFSSLVASAPVAVCTALPWESGAVRPVLRRARRDGPRMWRGFAGEREVLLVVGGVGPGCAQETLERLRHVRLAAVLSVGCAGALVPHVIPGQLILPPEVRMQSASPGGEWESFPVGPRLLACARAAAAKAAIPVAEGPLLTSTRVLYTADDKRRHGELTGAIAVEMESGVYAAFARERRLPFLPVRVVLDGCDQAIPIMTGAKTREGNIRPLLAAACVARNPRYVSAILTLARSRWLVADVLMRLSSALLPLIAENGIDDGSSVAEHLALGG